MALKSKVIFRERGKGEQQGAFIHVSSATQEKTKNFLENLTVAGCETLITYERPGRNVNRQEVVRHRRTTDFVCCSPTWQHEKLFLNLVELICRPAVTEPSFFM